MKFKGAGEGVGITKIVLKNICEKVKHRKNTSE